MGSKKKSLIIIAIILVIIIALAGTVAGVVLTGKISITSRQKLSKGLIELADRMSMSDVEENLKEYEKMQNTPFEIQDVISANINNIELEDSRDIEDEIQEIKNIVNNSTITNTLQADLKNNIIKENLEVKLADITDTISADAEYNKNAISLRSKELNEKYITLNKRDIQANYEYEDLLEVFELLEEICKKGTVNISLTDAEKSHFAENYKNIFSDFIKDDMIKEGKTKITVDGEVKECDDVNFTLNGRQIGELMQTYLDKLENDKEGQKIIVSKVQSIIDSFSEDKLVELISYIKEELEYIDDDISIKFSVYCSMFKTYGINITLEGSDTETIEMNVMFGKSNDVITVNLPEGKLSINKVDNKIEMSLEVEIEEEDIGIKVTMNKEVTERTQNSRTTKSTIGLVLKGEGNNIDVALNIDENLKYLDSIKTTANADSLNPITATEGELQEYLEEVQKNETALIEKVLQNSKVIQTLSKLVNSSYGGAVVEDQKPINVDDSKEFNNMFRDYTGNQSGSAIRSLLLTLATSNETNDIHKILVSIVEDETSILNATTNSQDINMARFNVDINNQYTILVTSLDEAGYITGIQIKKI